jgi:hypothetical protein
MSDARKPDFGHAGSIAPGVAITNSLRSPHTEKLAFLRKGKRLVIENGAGTEVNEGLVELIKEAFAIRNQLLSGSDDSIEAMTERLGMGKGHLTSLVRLSYLAPGIVRALLEGRQPIDLTPTRLLRLSKDLPHHWSEQRHFLGRRRDTSVIPARNALQPPTRKRPQETRWPFAPYAQAFSVSGCRRCVRRGANARKY